jgi:hypothetical protein
MNRRDLIQCCSLAPLPRSFRGVRLRALSRTGCSDLAQPHLASYSLASYFPT